LDEHLWNYISGHDPGDYLWMDHRDVAELREHASNLLRERVLPGNPNTDPHTFSYTDDHTDDHTNSYADCDTNSYANIYLDEHTDSDANLHIFKHADGDSNGDADGNTYGDPNRYSPCWADYVPPHPLGYTAAGCTTSDQRYD
jgi:hypothetical protein